MQKKTELNLVVKKKKKKKRSRNVTEAKLHMGITGPESRIRLLKTHVHCCLIMGMFNYAISQLLTLMFCTHLRCVFTQQQIFLSISSMGSEN